MVFKKVIKYEDIENSLNGRRITLANYQQGKYRDKNLFSKEMSYDVLTHKYEVTYFMSQELKKGTNEKSKDGLHIGEPKKFESHDDAINYYNNIEDN